MMQLVRLTIQDWGPFKGCQVFEFPKGPGLYFLWGRNEAEPRLGSNGAGKSRMWEAICWLFFGKTSRGIKAGDAANWEAGKGATVSLEYVIDNDLPYKVTRSWSPNSWVMVDGAGVSHDLAKDDVNQALSHLGLSFTAFLNTVWMPQRADMFLDLKADLKASLFSELLGLDRWLEHSQKAGKLAIEADARCRRLEKDVARLEGQLEQMDDRQTRAMFDGWGVTTARRLEALDGFITKHLALRKTCKQELTIAEAIDGEARTELAGQIKRHGARLDELEGLKAIVVEGWRGINTAEAHLRLAGLHLRFLQTHDHCQTCDQDLEPAAKRQNIIAAEQKFERLTREIESLELAHKKLTDSQLGMTNEAGDAMARINKQREVVVRSEFRLKDVRQTLARMDRELDDWEAEGETLESAKNPYAALLEASGEKQDRLTRETKFVRRQLDDAESRFRLFTYWVRGFKEIRLELIGDALTQLEIEVNSEISAVGLVGWELRFDADRETKSGSIQRGFSVSVVSPHNKRPVPWEAWSGGESQRLRMAAQAGLSNLSRTSTGADIDLEVWDEPTDGLGPEGVIDLLKSLESRAAVEQRQIWIVDHHSLSFGGFSGSAGVVKTKAGSQFELDGLYISKST